MRPTIETTRRDQMFPTLEMADIERVRQFGEPRSFAPGEAVATVGAIGPGFMIVLRGEIEVTQHDLSGRSVPIVRYQAGSFLGELAQLAGRPFLVDAGRANRSMSSSSRPSGCARCWSPRPNSASGSCAR